MNFAGTSQLILRFLFFFADLMWCHLLPDVRFFLKHVFMAQDFSTWEETHLIPSFMHFMRAYASHSFISCLLGYSFGGAMCPSRSGWSAWVLQWWSRNAEGPGPSGRDHGDEPPFFKCYGYGPGRLWQIWTWKYLELILEYIRWYKYVWNWEAPHRIWR